MSESFLLTLMRRHRKRESYLDKICNVPLGQEEWVRRSAWDGLAPAASAGQN